MKTNDFTKLNAAEKQKQMEKMVCESRLNKKYFQNLWLTALVTLFNDEVSLFFFFYK